MEQFIRMYEPHEARADTVLFPVIRDIESKHEFDSLRGEFEKKEHQLFGEDGFEKMVDQIARSPLLTLDRLSALERAAFLLPDVFDFSFKRSGDCTRAQRGGVF